MTTQASGSVCEIAQVEELRPLEAPGAGSQLTPVLDEINRRIAEAFTIPARLLSPGPRLRDYSAWWWY